MFVIAFGLGWYIMKHIFEKEKEPIEKLDTLFIWTVVATLLGARLGHVFFYDWEYYRNNLLEILLPFRFSPKFEFGNTTLVPNFVTIYHKLVELFPQDKVDMFYNHIAFYGLGFVVDVEDERYLFGDQRIFSNPQAAMLN